MDQNQNQLFGLSIDETSKSYLSETARWARFLAIAGFVCLGLMVLYGIILSVTISSMSSTFEDEFGGGYGTRGFGTAFGAGMVIFYLIAAVVAFFPLLFLLRFSNRMKAALESNEQVVLNESFRNLKMYYQYVGIVTIIGLVLMVIAILGGIMAGSMLMG